MSERVSSSRGEDLPIDVSEERILQYLRKEATRPLTAKELARSLGLAKTEEYRSFKRLLSELAREGRIYRQRAGRYAVPERLNLAVGRLQVTRAGDGFVVLDRRDEAHDDTDERMDVFVPGGELGSAVTGDIVVARIERRRRGRNPEGRIVRVLRRAWSRIVGTYHRKHTYGFVKAEEPLLRLEVFIPPGADGGAQDGQIAVAEIEEWGDAQRGPIGRVVDVLGSRDEPGVDVLAIVRGHGLPLEFPAEVEYEANRIAERGIREEDLKGREDLRDRLVLTIDPPDARDHDDALSVRMLDDGAVEVGVHIADVSHYVRPESALDREALERGTSVYLVDRVIPMLPHALSSDLCSLVPDRDRLAFSLLYRVTDEGAIEDSRLVPTVIRSRGKLSYDEAEAILSGTAHAPAEVAEALRTLRSVSRGIRERRSARGSIDFDLPEARVVLNASGEPTDIQRVLRLSTHLLIEDLMIQANETVADLATRQRLPLIYRVHESPEPEKLDGLRELAATFGHRLPAGKVTPKKLADLVRAMEGTPQEQLIATATLRSMTQARYSPENLGHFGLASRAYTHFTSPIRRYPDLAVHRQLRRWLRDRAAAKREGVSRLSQVAMQSSERERRAVEAERTSIDLKKIEFMDRHLGDEFSGTISGVTAFGFFVLLDEYHVDGLVHVSTLEDDYYDYVDERHALVGRRGGRVYQLGDPVRVQVARVDREERRIDYALLDDDPGRARRRRPGRRRTRTGGRRPG